MYDYSSPLKLDDVLSHDLLTAIVNDFDRSGLAVKVTGFGVEQITKYLEMKGCILTHENENGDIFAVPTFGYRA